MREPVEKVVYQTTDKPCLQWEVSRLRGLETGTGYSDETPWGWEPFAAVYHVGLVYRRCIAVSE